MSNSSIDSTCDSLRILSPQQAYDATSDDRQYELWRAEEQLSAISDGLRWIMEDAIGRVDIQ